MAATTAAVTNGVVEADIELLTLSCSQELVYHILVYSEYCTYENVLLYLLLNMTLTQRRPCGGDAIATCETRA